MERTERTEHITHGKLDEFLKWSLSKQGVLTITAYNYLLTDPYPYLFMRDFSEWYRSPWDDLRDEIRVVRFNLLEIYGENEIYIGRRSFWGCVNLEKLYFPIHSHLRLGEGAFYGCRKLADEKGYVIVNGVLFNYIGDSQKHLVIPDNVERIDDYAFSGNTDICSIEIRDDVELGSYAFNGCRGLSDENGFVIVGTGVFDYYGSEPEVVLPEGLTMIGGAVFQGHSELTKVIIPNGITEIGHFAFDGCKNLKEISLPEGLVHIGFRTFCGCGISEIALPDGLLDSGEESFHGCENLRTIILPKKIEKIYGEQQTCLDGALADLDADQIKYIVAPGTVTIEDFSFIECCWMKNLVIPEGVTKIGEFNFQHRSGYDWVLEHVSLPKSLEIIGCAAFSGNHSLKHITIPSGVTDIEESAFSWCGLEEIRFEGKPPFIDPSAFYLDYPENRNLLKIVYPAGDEEWIYFAQVLSENFDKLIFEPSMS